jgi:K+-sensing histidine kinase KdpD
LAIVGTSEPSTRLSGELRALTEVAKAVTSPLELPQLLNDVMGTIISVLDQADAGAIMLWDQPSGLFRAEAAFGYDFGALREVGLRAGESITGKVFDEGKARLLGTAGEVAEAMADMREANRAAMTRSLGKVVMPKCALAAPIAVGDQKLGVLVLETLDDRPAFEEKDLPFVQTLADLIALAIERYRMETKAEHLREARRFEYVRAEALATLSHQLRMPLAAIEGYATALLLDEVDWEKEKREEFLRLIEEECTNMEVMLREILDASIIDVDRLGIEPQPIRLPQLACEAAGEVQRRTQLHRLVVEFPPDFPILEADPRWIKQAFRNILDNAVKYSPDGGLIVIRGEVRPKDVVISVADQGIGISPEDLIPLFERYFRARAATQLHIDGIGLGLPIARTIVEAQGGRIWVDSKVGEGTTVFFSLPRADRAPEGDD